MLCNLLVEPMKDGVYKYINYLKVGCPEYHEYIKRIQNNIIVEFSTHSVITIDNDIYHIYSGLLIHSPISIENFYDEEAEFHFNLLDAESIEIDLIRMETFHGGRLLPKKWKMVPSLECKIKWG